MSYQIIQQPNGAYALFSPVSDRIVMFNCTPDEIVYAFAQGDIQATRAHVLSVIWKLEHGQNPYLKFQRTWNQTVNAMKFQHGGESVQAMLSQINERRSLESKESASNIFTQLMSGDLGYEQAQQVLADYTEQLLLARTDKIARMIEDAGIYDVVNTDALAASVRDIHHNYSLGTQTEVSYSV